MLDVDPLSVSGSWWRHIPAGGDPLHEPEDPADNRWQRGSVIDAWYFGDEPATVWAEWYRATAALGLPPVALLPRDLWRWELKVPRVADLSDEQRLARARLPVPKPSRKQWPAFQAAGEALHAEGYDGILAPSAARPASTVICLFRSSREVPGATPVPPPERIDDPPNVPLGMTT